ncbi:NAD(P)-dependent oxidoreductase [Paenibacillus sp. 2003]|uniref:NAD-dependent epimerase/dehydratase family protein n=1 Tax=Paenibacillus TaxID=44249 RepID=UPI0028564D76|nr:NAD(P)-dependent oxidoreductase [Paenibacillus sp. 2003]MDR6720299.1 UDP-glucose 4-epimerase [Paenibacillus sp. 2003]
MRTILVSGADGYIGLHLTSLLEALNYKVLKATRHPYGDIMMDFSQPAEIANITCNSIDLMVHCVPPISNSSSDCTERTDADNTSSVYAALNFCEKNGIPSFIYVSSFHVFGDPHGRLTEKSLPKPSNNYGYAHLNAEQTVQMFDSLNRVRTWIVRPSNVFGVPADMDKFRRWDLIPFSFCLSALEKREIALQTSGRQLRNFVSVSDLCRKIVWIIEKQPIERILHAYGKETLSVLDYAEIVKKVAKVNFQIPIQITKPDGSDKYSFFDFTSLYDSPDTTPKERLADFVNGMFEAIIRIK